MRVLTVTQVREHLYWAAGGPSGPGAPSLALLGRLFHDLYGALTGPDPRLNFIRPLELADGSTESWCGGLINHAFASVIAPALARQEGSLQSNGAEVMSFWQASRELCSWLARILHDVCAAVPERSLESWRSEIFHANEADLSVEINDPSWPEPITLQGRADAVLARPGLKQRCIVELKLGRTSPMADLLQGMLYHLMLSVGELARQDAALAMVSFHPTRHERLFEADELKSAQSKLKEVLAELAGFKQTPRSKEGPEPVIDPAPPHEVQELKRKLASAFDEYGAPLSLAEDTLSGPAFIRFFATPKRGVSAKRIASLTSSVWMRLRTTRAPQVALECGRLVIDVERADRQKVGLSDWQTAIQRQANGNGAAFAVGVRVDGKLHMANLADTQSPHLLVVGTTGSGKSEWLRAFLASLMATNQPNTLRFALIDPKRLAFSSMENSPFLLSEVVYHEGAIELLNRLVDEMELRYRLLQEGGADDLGSYNIMHPNSAHPRIVCVCDEFADLILRDKRTRTAVEERVSRLGAKGRAAGVHLVFATQRAGREVLKGTIDTNLPARVALAVPRATDSRMVLGEGGSENLLGKGDLLYKDLGTPVRLQGLLVSKEELKRLSRAQAL